MGSPAEPGEGASLGRGGTGRTPLFHVLYMIGHLAVEPLPAGVDDLEQGLVGARIGRLHGRVVQGRELGSLAGVVQIGRASCRERVSF